MCESKTNPEKLTREEKLEIFKNATIVNNFIFLRLMRNEKFSKKILEIVLGEKISKVKIIEYEKTIDSKYTQKSVRMDIYIEGEDVKYNIEMQVENKYNIVLRARYYSSMLDLNSLEKSKDYNELPESFIIFICLFDPFKEGQAKYVFNNQCRLDNGEYIQMQDKMNTIFLCANNYINAKDKDLRYFLEYIATQKVNDVFIQEVDEEIQAIKIDQETENDFMTFATNYMDDMRLLQIELKEKDHALEKQAYVIEEKEQIINAIMIKQLKLLDDDMIAEIYNITLEEVAKLREELL